MRDATADPGAPLTASGHRVTARRMERARDLLLAGNLPTDAVAAQVGYSNLAHFRESFARWLGMSPAALRRHDRHAVLAHARNSGAHVLLAVDPEIPG